MGGVDQGWLDRNLAVLARRLPALANKLAALEVPHTHVVAAAASGEPILIVRGVALENRFDPDAGARAWANEQTERLERFGAQSAIVVGMALGYHIEGLLKRWGGRIVVWEPDLYVIKSAISARDLQRVLERIEIVTEEEARGGEGGFGRALVCPHPPSILAQGERLRRLVGRLQSAPALAGPRLKVLVVSPMYGGSWEMAGYCASALGSLGHDARLLDMSRFWGAFRDIEIFGARKAARGRLDRLFADFLARGALASVEAWEPAVVLAMAQAPLTRQVLAEMGHLGAVRAMWFVEDHRHFDYWRDLAPELDYVFTIQREECGEAFRAVSDAVWHYLPCAADPAVHRPLDLSAEERERYGSDFSFVGAGYRNRRLAFAAFADCDFRIWGSDWEGAEAMRPFLQEGGRRVDTATAVRVFNATKVNLNLHSSTYHDGVDPRGDFVNPRTFEIAACGGFQVVDERKELPPLLEPGREVVTFSSVREMRELGIYYLERPEDRRELAMRARKAVLARHTYRHRMGELLGEILARDFERLASRGRGNTVQEMRPLVDGKLGKFMDRLAPDLPFTLDAVVASLHRREGPLSDEEAIFLFLHQFDELYLKDYRQ